MLARRIRTSAASAKSMSRKAPIPHARLLWGAQGGAGSLRNALPLARGQPTTQKDPAGSCSRRAKPSGFCLF